MLNIKKREKITQYNIFETVEYLNIFKIKIKCCKSFKIKKLKYCKCTFLKSKNKLKCFKKKL